MRLNHVDYKKIENEYVREYYKRLKQGYDTMCNITVDETIVDCSPRELVLIELVERIVRDSEQRILDKIGKK